MPLVRKLVNRYLSYSSVVAEKEDVLQAGAIGLMRAIQKYDPTRPTRFSTLATHWIRHETQTAVAHMMPMYRPKGSGMPYQSFKLGEEIEGKTGMPATAEQLGVTEVQLDKWRSLAYHFIPLDENRNDDENPRHRDVAADIPTADLALQEHEIEVKLTKCLKTMSEVERRVIIDGEVVLNPAYSEKVREDCIARLRRQFDEQ